jgi:hypothetical protein
MDVAEGGDTVDAQAAAIWRSRREPISDQVHGSNAIRGGRHSRSATRHQPA